MKLAHIAITFLSGAVIGGSAVYIFLKKKIQKEVEEASVEEIDAIQKAIEERYAIMQERKKREAEEKVETDISESTSTFEAKSSIQKPETTSKTNYAEWPKEPLFADEETEKVKNNPNNHPYVITEDERLEDDGIYRDYVKLIYIPSMDTITDDDGFILDDMEDVLGRENLKLLEDGDADEIIVRNDVMGADYLVVCEE